MNKRSLIGLTAWPSILWFFVFLLLPLLMVVIVSFATRGTYGGVQWIGSLQSYIKAFQPVYFEILWKSLQMAVFTASICTVLAFFMAWAMATAKPSLRNIWMTALMLPFLTNLVIRIYAIKLFVGVDGPLQALLSFLGLSFDPFYFTANAYLMTYGLITCYLPFAVFPLYSAFEKFDFSLVEAAQDLGAGTGAIIFKVLIPNLRLALISSFSLVFVPCLGEFVIPDLLGGAKQMLLGNLITDQFLKSRNWPMGSAISVGLFVLLLIFFLLISVLKEGAHERKS